MRNYVMINARLFAFRVTTAVTWAVGLLSWATLLLGEPAGAVFLLVFALAMVGLREWTFDVEVHDIHV